MPMRHIRNCHKVHSQIFPPCDVKDKQTKTGEHNERKIIANRASDPIRMRINQARWRLQKRTFSIRYHCVRWKVYSVLCCAKSMNKGDPITKRVSLRFHYRIAQRMIKRTSKASSPAIVSRGAEVVANFLWSNFFLQKKNNWTMNNRLNMINRSFVKVYDEASGRTLLQHYHLMLCQQS